MLSDVLGAVLPEPTFDERTEMKQELLEKFAAECERLAEEKETEREWLSDYANMVIEEAAKVCDTKAEYMAMMGGSCDPDVLAEQIRSLKSPDPDSVFSGRK